MVDGPEDDVPTMAGRVAVGADSDATAAEVRPPAGLEDEEEDKTVQSIALSESQQKAAPTPRMGPPRPVAARASTLQSALVPPGMPEAPVSAVASTEPDPTPPPTLASAGEEEEEAVTTTAPRISAPKIPLAVPGAVKISTVDADDDLQDETEVRTLAGDSAVLAPDRLPPTRAVASPPPPTTVDDDSTQMDATDDGPTTQAPAPRIGSRPELASQTSETAPPSSAAPSDLMRTRPVGDSNREPPTAPAVEKKGVVDPPTAPGIEKKDADAYDPEESITSRALAADLPEDSVTQQAPVVPATLAVSATGVPGLPRVNAPSSADDVTGGETTTKKREAPAAPADGEPESITTQAPGNLTNMLRVIAADAPGKPHDPIEVDDDDALPQNRTAVMVNAPIKEAAAAAGLPTKQPGTLQGFPPAPSPIGGGRLDTRSARAVVAAPRLEPESDSGLRVARQGSGSGERVSTGQLAHLGEDAVAEAPPHAAIPFAPPASPSLHDVEFATKTGPRYGLIVGIALAVSILVPILLYVALNRGGDEPSFEPTTFDATRTPIAGDPRTKGGKRGIPPPPSSSPH